MRAQNLSNSLIGGRYFLVRKIGVGGMATVYEAIDRELGKRVAVKVLKSEFLADAEQVGRFRQEARTAARVRHEHLVDVTDRGVSASGIPFLVMEYLEGKSLHDELIDNPGPWPWRRVIDIVVQVCGALDAAHAQGLVHRDIKPGNCFLVRRHGQAGDFVKVLDLGIAKVVSGPRDPHAPPSTRVGGGGPGTPEYMSPEQVTGEMPDAGSDIYALGVMMYRMLTGSLPFAGPWWKVLEMHVNATPPALRDLAPQAEIPASIEAIVMRAMSKSRADRWTGAAEVAAALRAAELAELPTMQAGSDDSSIRTAFYHPPEPTYTLPRTLFRWLNALQSFSLFLLASMSLMLIELPGVRTLADVLRPPPAPRIPRGTDPVGEARGSSPEQQSDTGDGEQGAPGPGDASRPEQPNGGATPPTSPPEVSQAAGDELPRDLEVVKSAPVPDDPGKIEKPRVDTARPADPAKAAKEFARRMRKRVNDECGDMLPEGIRIGLDVEFEQGTGRAKEVRVRTSRGQLADQCIHRALIGRNSGVKQGGTFPVEIQL